jgi:hypothetical protein
MPFVLNNIVGGGIITNYSCPSRCAHCLYRCSPRRESDYLTVGTAESLGRALLSMGCSQVHIGGGEPFLNIDSLCRTVAALAEVGVSLSYIETNAFWAVDDDTAIPVLRRLSESGVRCLLVSISPFHNEFIPFERTRCLLDMCGKTGMRVFPWVESFVPLLERLDPTSPHSLEEYEALFGDHFLPRVRRSYGITEGGRAIDTYRRFSTPQSADEIAERAGPCRELADTGHVHLDLNGMLVPGLCTGLQIPHHVLGGVWQEGRVINLLYDEGVGGLLEWARRGFGFQPESSGYTSKCDLCNHLRGWLVRTGEEFPDLGPRGYYTPDKRGER